MPIHGFQKMLHDQGVFLMDTTAVWHHSVYRVVPGHARGIVYFFMMGWFFEDLDDVP